MLFKSLPCLLQLSSAMHCSGGFSGTVRQTGPKLVLSKPIGHFSPG